MAEESNTAKGRLYERKTAERLAADGHHLVCCTVGSRGLFDVLATNGYYWRLIQVKVNRGITPAARRAILDCRVPENCSREIWVWSEGMSEPKVEVL